MITSLYNIIERIRRPLTRRKIFSLSSSLTYANGIKKPYLILSFDCDSPEDAIASKELSVWLMRKKAIPAVFAVPGRRIESSPGTYSEISRAGFEFMNHGYLDHAEFNQALGRYTSTTWYHEMSETAVREDIRRGHDTIRNILGIEAKGFRVPHFGYYQSPEQLEVIYSESERLGYSYASTTMPSHALHNGAAYRAVRGIIEFPLTGTFDRPEELLDSWCYMAAPDRVYTPKEYVLQFCKMVNFFANNGLPCILNYYADPSHVIDSRAYFDCIEYALESGFEATTYARLVQQVT
ncbi:MAG: polysaccharide deacetylase family protein [bacterium]